MEIETKKGVRSATNTAWRKKQANDSASKEKVLYRVVADTLRKVADIYKSGKIEKTVFSFEAQGYRFKLKEHLLKLMFMEPLEFGKRAEELLWRKVFYEPIQLVKQSKRASGKAGDMDSSYRLHLLNGLGFYQQLLLRLQIEFGVEQEGRGDTRWIDFGDIGRHCLPFDGTDFDGSISSRPLISTQSSSDEVKQWARKAIHHCLMYIGDLFRYQMDLKDNYCKDLARRYYHLALIYMPSIGMPHSQLGTLDIASHYGLNSVFHYLRCLVATAPFDGARGNLRTLFQRNQRRYAKLKEQKPVAKRAMRRDYRIRNVKQLIVQFLYLMEKFHAPTDEQSDWEVIQQLCQDLMPQLNLVLYYEEGPSCRTGGSELHPNRLGDTSVLRLLFICVMTLHDLQVHRGVPQDLSGESWSGLYYICMAFTLSVFDIVLTHSVNRLRSHLSVKLGLDEEMVLPSLGSSSASEEEAESKKATDPSSKPAEQQEDQAIPVEESGQRPGTEEVVPVPTLPDVEPQKPHNQHRSGRKMLDKRRRKRRVGGGGKVAVDNRGRGTEEAEASDLSEKGSDWSGDDSWPSATSSDQDELGSGGLCSDSSDENDIEDDLSSLMNEESPLHSQDEDELLFGPGVTGAIGAVGPQTDRGGSGFRKGAGTIAPGVGTGVISVLGSSQGPAVTILPPPTAGGGSGPGTVKERGLQVIVEEEGNAHSRCSSSPNNAMATVGAGASLPASCSQMFASGARWFLLPPGFGMTAAVVPGDVNGGGELLGDADHRLPPASAEDSRVADADVEDELDDVGHHSPGNGAVGEQDRPRQIVDQLLSRAEAIGEINLLAAVKLMCDWLRQQPEVMSANVAKASQGLWNRLAILLNMVHSVLAVKDFQDLAPLSSACRDSLLAGTTEPGTPITTEWRQTVPLSEDVHLRGFLGLSEAQTRMDFNLMPSSSLEECLIRVQALVEFGRSVARAGSVDLRYRSDRGLFTGPAVVSDPVPSSLQSRDRPYHPRGASSRGGTKRGSKRLQRVVGCDRAQQQHSYSRMHRAERGSRRQRSGSLSAEETGDASADGSEREEEEDREEQAQEELAMAEARRHQLMRDMAHLRLMTEVRQLSQRCAGGSDTPAEAGAGSQSSDFLSPYLIPDTHVLCSHLQLIKQLTRSGRFVVVVPKAVIDHLDYLKRISGQARDVIRYLESQHRDGNNYLRLQRPPERLDPRTHNRRSGISWLVWRWRQIIDCATYFAKAITDSRPSQDQDQEEWEGGLGRSAAGLVTVLTVCPIDGAAREAMGLEREAGNDEEQRQLDACHHVAAKSGIALENVETFVRKWKSSVRNQRRK